MTALLDRYIESSPGVCGSRPHLAGRRIKVADVAVLHLKHGLSLNEIAAQYDLHLAGVHAAMAYYFDQREQIDRQIAEDESYIKALEQGQASLLKAKLKSLRDG